MGRCRFRSDQTKEPRGDSASNSRAEPKGIGLQKQQRIKLFERNNADMTDAGRLFVEEARLSLLYDERAVQATRSDGK